MKKVGTEKIRVLGIAPSSRGIGFAIMETGFDLIDWGVKSVKGEDKNERCLAKVIDLISQFKPNKVVVENPGDSRRRDRVNALIADIEVAALEEGIEVQRLKPKEVTIGVFQAGKGTKHDLAKHFALRFPEELGFRLPAKRRDWTSEPAQMDIFSAVGLAEYALRGTSSENLAPRVSPEN